MFLCVRRGTPRDRVVDLSSGRSVVVDGSRGALRLTAAVGEHVVLRSWVHLVAFDGSVRRLVSRLEPRWLYRW